MRLGWSGFGAVLTLALVGCGQSAVPKKTLEVEVARELAAKVHRPAPQISCPKDLAGKVGAAEQCVLTDTSSGRVRLPVSVRVDQVNGSKVHFNIQVGRTPLG